MPDPRRVLLIFRRELTDALRDRRTVFMVLVVPLLLYPALVLGGLQFAAVSREADSRKTYGVMVAGLPVDRLQALIDDPQRPPADPLRQLRLVPLPPDWTAERAAGYLADEGEFPLQMPDGRILTIQVVASSDRPFEDVFTPRPGRPPPEPLKVRIAYSGKTAEGLTAASLARDLLEAHRDHLFDELLRKLDLGGGLGVLSHPVEFTNDNLHRNTGLLARQILGTLSLLLVVMALTGAFYPAVDLVAGEKERGTIETLLITPATRLETVLGKFGTVWAFSVATALANLASLGLTFWYVLELISKSGKLPPEVLPDTSEYTPAGLGWTLACVFAMLLPLSAMFSGLALALSAYARSAREGQYYLSPLFMIAMPLAMPAAVPESNLTAFKAQIPVMGVALALKDMLLAGHPSAFRWELIVPALMTTMLCAGASIAWGVRLFSREAVLFREAEEFSVGLWLRRSLEKPRLRPLGGDVAFLFTAAVAGFWFIGGLVSLTSSDAIAAAVATQVLVLLAPTLLYAGLLRATAGLDLTETFSLRVRHAPLLAVAPVMAVAALILTAAFKKAVEAAGIPTPAGAEEAMKEILGGLSPVGRVLVLAAMPALCEELLCRGFLLAGLRGRGRSDAAAIGWSALMFGLLHFLGSPVQVMYAGLLGLVLGWLVVRTGSILFGVVFHLTFNGVSVTAGPALETAPEWLQGVFAGDPAASAAAAVVLAGGLGLVHWATRPRAEPAAGVGPADPGTMNLP